MKYHLSRNGQLVGVFSVEEIQRLQDTGKLDGTEFVWHEGMSGWQPVVYVLKSTAGQLAQSEGGYSNRTRSIVLRLAAVIVVLSVAAMIWIGWVGVKYFRSLNNVRRTVTSSDQGQDAKTDAYEAASQPVNAGTNSATVTDARKREHEFRKRQYFDGYQARGERNPKSDDLVLDLIKQWVDARPDSEVDTNFLALQALGNQLAADPNCTDPLALTVAAVTCTELHEENHRLERALKEFGNSKHRSFPRFFATVTLADKLMSNRESQIPQFDSYAIIYLEQAFTDGSLRPEDQGELGEILVNDWGKDFFERNADNIVKLVEHQGEPYRWLALTLRGENEINKAWAARGGGYANSVSGSGWQGFNTHLANAGDALAQAWQLKPELPLAPCLMMTVRLGDSDIKAMREWFDHTVAAQIDYAPAWKEMRWGLRPRWYGDRASMLAFGITALNTHRFDTDVPRMFFDSIKDIEEEYGSQRGGTIYADGDIWPHLKEMYEGYIAADTDAYERDDWRTRYAVVAYLTSQDHLAAKQLEAMNWQPHAALLTGWGQDVSLMTKHVHAFAGPLQPQLKQAAQLYRATRSKDIDSLLKDYDRIAADPQADAATVDYVHEREAGLRLTKQFRSGEWFNFLPTDTNFFGWNIVRGQFTVEPDGSLDVKSDENGHIIYARMPVRTDFEVRGEYVVESSTTKAFQGGLVMGLPEFETYNWYAFRMKRNDDEGDVASFSQHWTTRQLSTRIVLAPVTNSFYFRFQHGLVTAMVDGQEVFKDSHPPSGAYVSTNRMFLGLGAFNDSNITAIRYRNVQVRSLVAATDE